MAKSLALQDLAKAHSEVAFYEEVLSLTINSLIFKEVLERRIPEFFLNLHFSLVKPSISSARFRLSAITAVSLCGPSGPCRLCCHVVDAKRQREERQRKLERYGLCEGVEMWKGGR